MTCSPVTSEWVSALNLEGTPTNDLISGYKRTVTRLSRASPRSFSSSSAIAMPSMSCRRARTADDSRGRDRQHLGKHSKRLVMKR